MTAHVFRRWCPDKLNSFTAELRDHATFAAIGASLRKAEVENLEREIGETIGRYSRSEARNHYREHVEQQFGKGL